MGHMSSSSQPAGYHYTKNSKGPELSDRQTERLTEVNLLVPELFFLILAHPVYNI